MIAVLMPVYNRSTDAWRTIASFREPALARVRIVVVDDGSEPPFPSQPPDAALAKQVAENLRIDVIRLDRNGGIERALAIGVETLLGGPGDDGAENADGAKSADAANGGNGGNGGNDEDGGNSGDGGDDAPRYIARMDAGDLALPERLTKQQRFLDAHPDVGALGMWAQAVTRDGRPAFVIAPPTSPHTIRRQRFARSCFIHPAMMLRSDTLRVAGNYRADYPAAEDLDLFLRIMQHTDCANLPEIGIVYEINADGVSATRRRLQVRSTLRLQCRHAEPGNPYDWIGLGKNLLHLVLPYSWLYRLKRQLFTAGRGQRRR